VQGSQRGKSPIEILMVITIIGILVSFLLSVIAGAIKRTLGVGTPQDPNDPDSTLLGRPQCRRIIIGMNNRISLVPWRQRVFSVA